MYFDAVIDSEMTPVFNGTPQEVRAWLDTAPDTLKYNVCIGADLRIVSVEEYLKGNKSV
jgi:hypothetical protein